MRPTEANSDIARLLGIDAIDMAFFAAPEARKFAMSMLFFSDVRPHLNDRQRYQLVRDLTCFADQQGFEAIYLPERHFCQFGSIFPNSAVMAAHLIPETERIRFRTAGISLPLHHPTEVVEWWAMNDVLSSGRVDLGFGSGWNKADFVVAPEHFELRKTMLSAQIDMVKRLWRGETVQFSGPDNESFDICVYPRPIQSELNVWMLVAKNQRGFIEAGKQGHNVFTMLYGDDLDTLAEKIKAYRDARAEAGFSPATGRVTLMLHTLVGPDKQWVKQAVETPFKEYIKSTLGGHLQAQNRNHYDEASNEQILDYAWLRYFEKGALFGSVDDARAMLEQVIAAGVDEVACLMDFGVEHELIHHSLAYLSQLKTYYA